MPIEMKCANCNEPFYCYPSDAETGRKYCSLTCRSAHRFKKELPVASRTPVSFTCKECSKPFVMMQSYLTAYRKKFGRDPAYCSMACSNIGRRKDADERNKFKCVQCGKEQHRNRKTGGRIYLEQKFCNVECKSAHQRSKAFAKFESGNFGRHIKRHGYVYISVPALANDGEKRTEMLEHRYVMQKHLGRPLHKDETVHHRDGNRAHNDLSNLELFSSRHGPGQRVIDKIAFAIEMLQLYPEFGRAAGFELKPLEHVSDAQPLGLHQLSGKCAD